MALDTLIPLSDSDREIADPQADIRGRDVLDSAGDKIGTVHDLLLDEDDLKVRFLEVAHGGFLGIGQETTYIPVDAVRDVDEDSVTVDQSRETIEGAPAYDPALVRDRGYYEGLFDYYGYGPYWAPGYMYPAFPAYR